VKRPANGADLPAHGGPSTNGHHAPSSDERADEEIIVWRTPEGGAAITKSTALMERFVADREAVLADEPVEGPAEGSESWLGVDHLSRFVNFHFVLGVLRRGWRRVLGFALAGLVVGMLLAAAFAPPPRAAATVLLVHPATGDRAAAMVTDAQLLNTQAVARRVVDALRLPETSSAFAASSQGNVLSDDLLGISVSATSAREALRRTNSLAHEYLAYRAEVYERQSKAVIAGLQERGVAIQSQIRDIETQLGSQANLTTSADPAIAALLGQRASLGEDLAQLTDSISAQKSSTTTIVDGSSVIDTASIVGQSKLAALAVNGLSGLAAGLGIGLAVVVVGGVTSNRVWRRDDVAEALRHPVDLSTGRIRVRRWARRHGVRRLVQHPPPELAKIDAHLRDVLAAMPVSDRSLAVIAIGGLEVAAASARATAATLADDGRHVDVQAVGSTAAKHAELLDGAAPTSATEGEGGDDGFVLLITVLDPADGAEPLRPLTSSAVAIVAAGRSTMTTLRNAADMLEAANIALRSVVLVGSDPLDDSLGRAAGRQAGASALDGASSALLPSAAS
jgi:capsular polysaccharide biosynthesis protein